MEKVTKTQIYAAIRQLRELVYCEGGQAIDKENEYQNRIEDLEKQVSDLQGALVESKIENARTYQLLAHSEELRHMLEERIEYLLDQEEQKFLNKIYTPQLQVELEKLQGSYERVERVKDNVMIFVHKELADLQLKQLDHFDLKALEVTVQKYFSEYKDAIYKGTTDDGQ